DPSSPRRPQRRLILIELVGREDNPIYQELEVANGNRQYDFLRSMVLTSLAVGKPFLSQQILKALNFHAIACLHPSAGEYRPCPVVVGDYHPPEHYRVGPLMDDFVNTVNRNWELADPVALASVVLWRLNAIHRRSGRSWRVGHQGAARCDIASARTTACL